MSELTKSYDAKAKGDCGLLQYLLFYTNKKVFFSSVIIWFCLYVLLCFVAW